MFSGEVNWYSYIEVAAVYSTDKELVSRDQSQFTEHPSKACELSPHSIAHGAVRTWVSPSESCG